MLIMNIINYQGSFITSKKICQTVMIGLHHYFLLGHTLYAQ